MAKHRFRLMAGQHVADDLTKPVKDDAGKLTGRFEQKTFKAGDVIESDKSDLSVREPQRYQALDDIGAAQVEIADLKRKLAAAEAKVAKSVARANESESGIADAGDGADDTDGTLARAGTTHHDDLDGKTVRELREIAAVEGVAIPANNVAKPDVVAAIRAHRAE